MNMTACLLAQVGLQAPLNDPICSATWPGLMAPWLLTMTWTSARSPLPLSSPLPRSTSSPSAGSPAVRCAVRLAEPSVPVTKPAAYKTDVEGNYLKTLELSPAFAARVRDATRVERFAGGSVPNFFRRPYGRGWVLVGDAGYNKDPITAQGMSDAFSDAELCSAALDEFFCGVHPFDEAMSGFQRTRDTRALPIYEFTTQLATLEQPPPEMQQLLGAISGNRDAMDEFVSITAGTVSPVDFFDPRHIGEIMGAAVQ